MFLGGYNCPCFARCLNYYFFIYRLYCVDVYHARVYTVLFQKLCRFTRIGNHKPCCNYGGVASVLKGNALSKLKPVLVLVKNLFNRKPPETKIYGAVVLYCRLNRRHCLYMVGRVYYNHTGNGAHNPDVLKALMRCAVLTHGDTGVCCAYFYIKARICHAVSYLLKRAPRGKHCKRAYKYRFTGRCNTRCGGNHISLRNTRIYKTLRKFLFKSFCLC